MILHEERLLPQCFSTNDVNIKGSIRVFKGFREGFIKINICRTNKANIFLHNFLQTNSHRLAIASCVSGDFFFFRTHMNSIRLLSPSYTNKMKVRKIVVFFPNVYIRFSVQTDLFSIVLFRFL